MDESLQVATRPWDVQALGALRVGDGNNLRPIAREAPRRLLAYLVINHAAPVSRERLIDALWPDLPIGQGRRRLSDAVYQLRRCLPPAALEALGEQISLGTDLRVDLWAFERLAASSDPAGLRSAISLYAGDLLPEIYDDWVIGPRVINHERFLDCLEQLASNEPDEMNAVGLYRRLVDSDPLREAAHVGLMRALVRAGRPVEAIESYEQLEQILAAALGVSPGRTARALVARLREQRAGSRQLSASIARRLARPPFVGRAPEQAALLGRLDVARAGRGGLVLLIGEAGIGKTRLAEEAAAAAAWRGWAPFVGGCEERVIAAPFAPLGQALAAALPRPRRQQLSRIVPAEALATVERMIWPGGPGLPPAGSDLQVNYQRIAAAVSSVLGGLAGIAPPLLILDDVQWAGPDLWPLLDALHSQVAERPALVLLIGRTQELRALPGASLALDRWTTQGGVLINLAGLSYHELADLAHGCGVDDRGPEGLAQLAADCGGNPLLALGLLRTGPTADQGARSLEGLAARRMALLSPPARRAAEAAAVIGARLDYPLWEKILVTDGYSVDELPALVGELERDGVLCIEERGYRFAHHTLQAAIYSGLAPGQRQVWHGHILAALTRLASDDHTNLLHHADRAGDRAAIARHAQGVGEQALAAASYAAARRAFERALEVLEPAALAERYAAAAGLVASLEVLAERGPQRAASEEMALIAERLGDDGRRAEAAWRRAGLEWAVGQFAAAAQIAGYGLAAAERQGDRRLQALLSEMIGRCARDLGDYERASRNFLAARAAYVDLDDARGAAWIDGMLGLVAQRQGRLREAIDYQTQAAEAFRSAGDPYHEMRALNGLAIALWWAGDYLGAREIFERTLELSSSLGDGRIQESGLHNLGALADLLGDYEAAVELKSRALARSRAAENPMGIAVGLCNLGITYFKLGRYGEALAALDESLALDRRTGRRTGEAFCLHSRGQVLAAAGLYAEARQAFEAAQAIRRELGERDVLLSTEAELILLSLTDGQARVVSAAVEDLLARLAPTDRAEVREHVHYTAYRVFVSRGAGAEAAEQLRLAAAAMHELLDALPAESRGRLLQRDPLHRAIAEDLRASASLATVRLVRAGVSLGRRLTAGDYVEIRWTLSSPEDRRFVSAATRRRYVLRRLLREAADQGGAPTDADLARALGVSRRTILRDMAAITAEGSPAPTRRRLSQ